MAISGGARRVRESEIDFECNSTYVRASSRIFRHSLRGPDKGYRAVGDAALRACTCSTPPILPTKYCTSASCRSRIYIATCFSLLHLTLAITNLFTPDIGPIGCSWERPVPHHQIVTGFAANTGPDRSLSGGIKKPCSHICEFGYVERKS